MPLLFWKKNSPGFPILSRAAREIYCIPASQSTSERTFSWGTHICTPKRSNLDPHKVEELITIKLNEDFISDYKEEFKVPELVKPENATVEYDTNPFVETIRFDSDSDSDELEFV